MKNNSIALGIDGGASHLKWVIRLADGATHEGQAAGANLQVQGWDDYLTALSACLDQAAASAGIALSGIESAGLGLSGVDRPAERERLTAWIETKMTGLRSRWVGNDAWPALRAGAGAMEGIILIAGTGSICLGAARCEERIETVRVGGWGDVLGDEGSAYALGRDLLAIALQMDDGRLRTTELLPAVLKRLELQTAPQIIAWLAAHRATRKADMAGLSSLVFELACNAEPMTLGLINDAAQALGEHVATAAERLDRLTRQERAPWPVVLAGGLLEHREDFRGAVEIAILRTATHLHPALSKNPASLGALALGQEQPAI